MAPPGALLSRNTSPSGTATTSTSLVVGCPKPLLPSTVPPSARCSTMELTRKRFGTTSTMQTRTKTSSLLAPTSVAKEQLTKIHNIRVSLVDTLTRFSTPQLSPELMAPKSNSSKLETHGVLSSTADHGLTTGLWMVYGPDGLNTTKTQLLPRSLQEDGPIITKVCFSLISTPT